MKKSVLVEAAFIFVLGALGLYDGIRLTKVHLLNPDPVGPGWYLIIFAGLLVICGILYLVLPGYRKEHREEGGGEGKLSWPPAIGQGGWLMIVQLGYVIALPILSFTAATGLFFIFAMRIAGVKSWFRSVVYGVIMALTFTFFFSTVAGMSLP